MTARDRVLAWYDRHRRDLPWRRTGDPWAIWVSEIMCQQTRVDSVIPYWRRFLERFPTPADLATAPVDDVLSLWAGLGYYSRARNLQKGAAQVVERHGGRVPDDPQAFGDLAGVGRYTCGAVQSIAFGRRIGVVDGNVSRVLSRLHGIETDPSAPATKRRLWALADAWADAARPGDANQALMELGATVCSPRKPECLLCPLRPDCAAAASGDPERIPAPRKRPQKKDVARICALVEDAEGVWLGRRPDEGLLPGLWELPSVDGTAVDGLDALGLAATTDPPHEVIHTFTHLRWTMQVHRATGTPRGGDYTRMEQIPHAALRETALSGPALKGLRAWSVEGAPVRRGAGRRR
jgi:A/G-specific adenine glycosylase